MVPSTMSSSLQQFTSNTGMPHTSRIDNQVMIGMDGNNEATRRERRTAVRKADRTDRKFPSRHERKERREARTERREARTERREARTERRQDKHKERTGRRDERAEHREERTERRENADEERTERREKRIEDAQKERTDSRKAKRTEKREERIEAAQKERTDSRKAKRQADRTTEKEDRVEERREERELAKGRSNQEDAIEGHCELNDATRGHCMVEPYPTFRNYVDLTELQTIEFKNVSVKDIVCGNIQNYLDDLGQQEFEIPEDIQTGYNSLCLELESDDNVFDFFERVNAFAKDLCENYSSFDQFVC